MSSFFSVLKMTKKVHGGTRLAEYTIRYIHEAVISHSDSRMLEHILKIGDINTLHSHLGRFLFEGQPLTVQKLQDSSIEYVSNAIGESYDKPMGSPLIELQNYGAAYIHKMVRESSSIRQAANLLGTRDHTICRYLMRYKFKGLPLTYHTLKTLSAEDAHQIFRKDYKPHNLFQRQNLTPNFDMQAYPLDPDSSDEELISHLSDEGFIIPSEHNVDPDFFLLAASISEPEIDNLTKVFLEDAYIEDASINESSLSSSSYNLRKRNYAQFFEFDVSNLQNIENKDEEPQYKSSKRSMGS